MPSEHFVIEDIPVEVRFNRRRRSRIGLVLDPAGYVVLDAPTNVSEAEVRALIVEHQRWLRYRLRSMKEAVQEVGGVSGPSSRIRYEQGQLLHYLGEPLTLALQPARVDSLIKEDATLKVFATDCSEAAIAERVKAWYRARATEVFASILEDFRRLPWLKGELPPWGHRFMRSQWGSCSAKGRLSFNTHLIKTPREVIAYVVLHELCHLQHHHHGPAFHALLAEQLPDWRQHSATLDQYLTILMQD